MTEARIKCRFHNDLLADILLSRLGISRALRKEMSCRDCQSENQKTFPSEMNIHFPGLENLDKPSVWVFPELLVCLDCGFTELRLQERERSFLAAGSGPDSSVA